MKDRPLEAASRVFGIETEYAIARQAGAATMASTRAFFEKVCANPIAWDMETESSFRDARSMSLSQPQKRAREKRSPAAAERERTESSISISLQLGISTLLPNGARFYIDHQHPEYCTPECTTAGELVAHDKAGERLLLECVETFNRGCEPGERVCLYKNSSDHQGNSYGCHENYTMGARSYRQLFNNRAHRLYCYLIPYLVSRQVLCGGGKVGAEQRSRGVDYQISQRADFIACVMGLQTQYHRPIVNTRDEPHADPDRWRRLHLICGDPNMTEWSTYLKVAATQLVLEMLEAEALREMRDVTLADPVAAFAEISRDPEMRSTVELERGPPLTAIEIQQSYIEAAARYVSRDAGKARRWSSVLEDWSSVVKKLAREPESLDRVLDWRVKWRFMKEQLGRKNICWQSPQALEMDMRYHQLDEKKGFFYLLSAAGQVDSWLKEGAVDQACSAPPATTRAFLRGWLVRHYRRCIESANWDLVKLRMEDHGNATAATLRMSDPGALAKSTMESFLAGGCSLERLLERLEAEVDGIEVAEEVES